MVRCDRSMHARLTALLTRYGLALIPLPGDAPIPGSYWGAPEAGIVGHTVYARADTPAHSVLHEAAHVVCMDGTRRARLHTDAGGDYAEEDAVCYLQILLAAELGLTVAQACADMDAWGYTFRLGSAQAWFERDAGEARAWLVDHGLLAADGAPTFRLRAA
jgi:hypothetical protein